MLMTALTNEDETTIQMEYAPETKCRTCDEGASYDNATAATHTEILAERNATDMWREPKIIINGSQIFVTGIPNMKRFWDRNVNTIDSMFGEYNQFQSFAEYRSNDRGLSGHYQAWVRGENGMGCISDKDNKGEQHDVDLENFVVTI
ncbi:hypothetical protein GCK72_011085 [Caenorhabditis remanei]|nr:hypothetical protein GCK72_011085 [Caenorhabditis remanei]KAF1762822.1 hypothetical protein GCK72_011085 [Caenorhabditis remanei]